MISDQDGTIALSNGDAALFVDNVATCVNTHSEAMPAFAETNQTPTVLDDIPTINTSSTVGRPASA
jgi:hypothetical protein